MIKSVKDILELTESLNLEHEYLDLDDFLDHVSRYLYKDKSYFNDVLNSRLSCKEPYYYDFDGRRILSLKVIYYSEVPICIIQNAGREGNDYEELFVLNKPLFISCINYIDSLCKVPEYDRFGGLNVVDEDYCKENLTNFYGHNINNFVCKETC